MKSSSHRTPWKQEALSTHTLVENFNCDYCQKNKLDGKGYGFLPSPIKPVEECAADLIGPWTVQVRGRPYEFMALTAIVR